MNQDLLVRINGVLPDVAGGTNTSISVFFEGSHLLVDAGNGVATSLKQGAGQLGLKESPDVILVTSARKEHIADLAQVLGSAKAYCTSECLEQLAAMPQLAGKRSSFTAVSPGQAFSSGPFSVTPIAANNAGDAPGAPGSVIYVVEAGGKKVIAGWDFLTLPGVDEKLLWKPDLLVLGTETYNEHPSTGMISVSEAYNLVRRWNAKDSYILHYSGEMDKEDAKNQWHRGPAGPLSPEDLQKALDSHLLVSGQEGKFSIKVAREGTIWKPAQEAEDEGPIGPKIEVEALEKHVFRLEKMPNGRLTVSIEDAINVLKSEFVSAKRTGDNSLHAEPEKSGFFKGPELNMIVSDESVKLEIVKGKKPMFAKDMPVSGKDASRLKKYIAENFG